MASKVISKSGKTGKYGVIQRGASLTIPVEVKDETDQPIDLTGLRVEFTVKKVKNDFDRHDDFAYIVKSFLPQDPKNGKFYVLLSSDDTDFEPGDFYFDVELVQLIEKEKENEDDPGYEYGMVFRLFTFEFTLDGGPTNRRVNKGMGQWPTGDTITVVALAEGNPIIVVAPTINLDGDIFGQIADLMEIVDRMETHIKDCDTNVKTLSDDIDEVKDALKTLRQEFDNDHIELETAQSDIQELTEDVGELQDEVADHRETLETHGNLIQRQEEKTDDLIKRVAAIEEFCRAVDQVFKLYLWKGE